MGTAALAQQQGGRVHGRAMRAMTAATLVITTQTQVCCKATLHGSACLHVMPCHELCKHDILAWHDRGWRGRMGNGE